ncbi:hypothetical protein ACJX0J_025895, partial [Zea mays]
YYCIRHCIVDAKNDNIMHRKLYMESPEYKQNWIMCEVVLSITLEKEAIDFHIIQQALPHIIGNWSIVKKEQSCLILKSYIILKYLVDLVCMIACSIRLEATTEVNVRSGSIFWNFKNNKEICVLLYTYCVVYVEIDQKSL